MYAQSPAGGLKSPIRSCNHAKQHIRPSKGMGIRSDPCSIQPRCQWDSITSKTHACTCGVRHQCTCASCVPHIFICFAAAGSPKRQEQSRPLHTRWKLWPRTNGCVTAYRTFWGFLPGYKLKPGGAGWRPWTAAGCSTNAGSNPAVHRCSRNSFFSCHLWGV